MENMEDMEKLRKEGESPEDDNFKVQAIATVEEAIKYAMVDTLKIEEISSTV